jgi:hypothetical protein
MAHLQRAIPDAKLQRGYVTVGNDLKAIDQNTFVAVNGDAGGTWTPAATLAINGAGVVAAGPWSVSGSQMTVNAPTFGKGTADDVFGLSAAHPGRSQTLNQPLVECYSSTPEGVVFVPGFANFISWLQTTKLGVRFLTPLRVFGGATLETVTLKFSIAGSHGALPAVFPQMRVIAIDGQGNVMPMGSGTLFDAGGFHAITAVSTSAAYNALVNATFVYTCSQNNVIDRSKYTYWLEIIEESGANSIAGNVFISAVSFLDNITLFDGRN